MSAPSDKHEIDRIHAENAEFETAYAAAAPKEAKMPDDIVGERELELLRKIEALVVERTTLRDALLEIQRTPDARCAQEGTAYDMRDIARTALGDR